MVAVLLFLGLKKVKHGKFCLRRIFLKGASAFLYHTIVCLFYTINSLSPSSLSTSVLNSCLPLIRGGGGFAVSANVK